MGSEALFAAINTDFPPGKDASGARTISGLVLKMVAIVLANRMNGGGCFLSYAAIAKAAGGIDRKTAIAAARLLEDVGLFDKARGTKRASNSWTLKRKTVREEGGRWHFEGWGFEAPIGGTTPPGAPDHQSHDATSGTTPLGGGTTPPALVAPRHPNDLSNDVENDRIDRVKAGPDPGSDSIPRTGNLAPESKPQPVEPVSSLPAEPEVSVCPSAQSAATLPNAAPPERRLVPVDYISPNSLASREPETEKLVEMFLNYQGNPGYNEKSTLLHWHSVLSRLLKTYPSLAAYMKFGFETDPFWSSGKLIRGKNSKGKDWKKYPDPVDYFEDMLEHIVTNFNRWQKGKANAKARKAAAPTAGKEESLWGFERIINEQGLEETKEHLRQNEKEYERLHPDWVAEFKERGII